MTIIKTLVKQYRKSFFEQLHAALLADGIRLEVVYGAPTQRESSKGDNIDLPSPLGRRIPSYYIWQEQLLFQWPGWRQILNSDLIITVNANRNVLNLPLLMMSRLKLKKVALWGHGQNHQRAEPNMRERFKRTIATWPYWWFAYTESTASYLAGIGYDWRRITTINNAVDTTSFSADVSSVTTADLCYMRAKLNLNSDDYVVIYCGSLYREKRLPTLLEAARMVANVNTKFRLLIIGSGPMEHVIKKCLDTEPYLRYTGALFGHEKAICYSMAKFVLNPGLVGLAILDAFAAGRPLLTLADSLHSPEIAYLNSGKNGLLIQGDTKELAAAILQLLDDPLRLTQLSDGARDTSSRYGIQDMVDRVRGGVQQCLIHPLP